MFSMSRVGIVGSMHHARHLASSEEELDSHDCRSKAIQAFRFHIPSRLPLPAHIWVQLISFALQRNGRNALFWMAFLASRLFRGC